MVPIFDSEPTPESDLLPAGYQEKPNFAEKGARFFSSLYEWIANLPITSFFFYPFPYVFVIPMILALSVIESRKWNYLAFLVPPIISIAGFLLSPITGMTDIAFEAMRYMLPFIYSSPILLLLS